MIKLNHLFCFLPRDDLGFKYFKEVFSSAIPAKDFHEDVRDINHQVHRVIPTDNVKGWSVFILGFSYRGNERLGLLGWGYDWHFSSKAD